MKMRFAVRFALCLAVTLSLPSSHANKEPQSPAERIAYAGHGMLFDRSMKQLKLDGIAIAQIQDAMLAELLKTSQEKLPKDVAAAIGEAQKLLLWQKLSEHESVLLKSGVIDALLRPAPKDLSARYLWRHKALTTYYVGLHPKWRYLLRADLLELLRRLGFFDPPNLGSSTGYMADCRAHGVPIPPDWAESGTAWQQQGTLTRNLLDPGGYAAVWTYSDPANRGACIALPRGSGAAGSAAGIICQSATTGHACFWDNKRRDDPMQRFIGWSGRRLVISELADGSNLYQNCTGCHRGNNVYLISPDDATWGKVLRGPLTGGSTGTFTTRVEVSSDNRGGRPRYIPITTLPERPGWENTFNPAASCAGSCHEIPLYNTPPGPGLPFNLPPMPPACASPTVANCYGTP